MEVVLLLQTRIAPHLRRARSQAVESIRRDRLGDDDTACRTTPEAVLHVRELVVEGVRRRNAERPCGQRQLVGRVRERDVEALPARVATKRAQAAAHRAGLSDGTRSPVARSDHVVLDRVQREELRGLRVLASRDRHLVPALAEE